MAAPMKPAMPKFELPTVTLPKNQTMADTMYERIVHAIKEFEDGLAKDEEAGAMLAQFGDSITITIDDVTFHNPHLIKFHGTTPAGDRCTLVQHMNQVNVLFVAVKTQKPEPKRIGFKLEKALEVKNAPDDGDDEK
jgi:hypothetical protein